MREDDDEILWSIPIGRNANFGVVLVLTGIGGIIWVLLSFGLTIWGLVATLVTVGLILVGSYIVVVYDEHGRRIVNVTRDYYEETLYEKESELLGRNTLLVGVSLVRRWGSVDLSATGSHYFHDFGKNRLSLSASADAACAATVRPR